MSDLFSIERFVSTVAKKGFSDQSKYQIVITSNSSGSLGQDEATYCCSVTIPSTGFSVYQQDHHGPAKKIVVKEKYDQNINLKFYKSIDNAEFNFFYKWMMDIGKKDFYIPYLDDYKGELALTGFDKSGKANCLISCDEVFPVTLTEYSYSYSAGSTIPTFEVSLETRHVEFKSL